MDNRITIYNGKTIYSVTSINGTYFYYENSTGLLIVNECTKLTILPTNQLVQVEYKQYYIKPENRVNVENNFPNELPKDLVNASQKVEFRTTTFTVGSTMYNILFPSYFTMFKHVLNGKISSEPDFVEGADLINRNGIELYDSTGNYFHPVEIAVSKTDETVNLNDGTITVTIPNSWDGTNYEASIDGITWQSITTNFTNLSPGDYTVIARHITDLKNSLPTTITINPNV